MLPNPPVQVTCFLLLFLSPTIIHSKPVFIIVDAALAAAVGAGAAAAIGAAGAGATAAIGVASAGATAAAGVIAAGAAALVPVGAAAVAAAPNLLLGKALVGSGFLIGASAGSKTAIFLYLLFMISFSRPSSTTEARMTQSC